MLSHLPIPHPNQKRAECFPLPFFLGKSSLSGAAGCAQVALRALCILSRPTGRFGFGAGRLRVLLSPGSPTRTHSPVPAAAVGLLRIRHGAARPDSFQPPAGEFLSGSLSQMHQF